jgi:uncharacterized protein (DUF58 family)
MSVKVDTQQINQWLSELHTDGSHLDLTQLLRYQRLTHLLDLAPRQTIQSKLAGSYLAKTKGRGMEFDEVRHYQPGDDVRTIDWRVTARTGKVHTKLFREEKERPVFILTDLSSSMQFGSELLLKSVQAAHLAALIAWHVKKTGDKLGGILFNDQSIVELKPAGRHVAVLRYLHQLIALQKSNKPLPQQQSLATALGQLRRLARPGSLLFVISDFSQLDEQCLRHLQAMRMHNEIRLCQLTDPFEKQTPKHCRGSALVSDGKQAFTIELSDQLLWQRFSQQQVQAQQLMETSIQLLGLRPRHFSAARPLALQLTEASYG